MTVLGKVTERLQSSGSHGQSGPREGGGRKIGLPRTTLSDGS